MQITKVLAGSLAAITAGATIAFGAHADLGAYVKTSGSTLASPMIVVGDSVPGSDVIGAADLAAAVAGYATTKVAVSGGTKELSISGEGKEVSTANTKIYLDNTLGKSGVRSTMTKQDLPTLLASGSLFDNGSTTIKFDQFLFLTPNDTSDGGGDERNFLQFERPSSSSSDDGAYSFGRFLTSPNSDYFVNYRFNFKKDVDFDALVGKTIKMLGETYTILAESDTTIGKLVATKSAADRTMYVSDDPATLAIGSSNYEVKLVGTSSATVAVISVNGVAKSATKGLTTNINGLDVYVDDVFYLSTTDTSINGVKVLIGAEKVIFQHANKIKVGTNEDNVEGTWVQVTYSGNKASTIDVFLGAPASSVTDNLRAGSKYALPGFPKVALHFPGMSEDLKASSRNILKITPSGDNLLQMSWTDDKSSTATTTWAYKGVSAGTQFNLADSSGNQIHVVENVPVSQDQYVVLDAGDFPHMTKLTSIDSSALSFTLQDVFSGESTKHEMSVSDNGQKTVYIDGQAYRAQFNPGNTTINFTWGAGSGFNNYGDFRTIWPTLKGKNGEHLALLSNITIPINATASKKLQLPTGAVTITVQLTGADVYMNLTAATDDKGQTSACTTTPCLNAFNLSATGNGAFTLGKTATTAAAVKYNITSSGNSGEFTLRVVGQNADTAAITQPGLLLVEEKDDSSDIYSILVTASTEASGSNQVAIPTAPIFTATEDSVTKGTDSNVVDYVDLYGTYATRTTSGQDTLTLYYPDEQVFAVVGAGAADATASVGGAAGGTVDSAVKITNPVAKFAREVSTTGLASDLILVGGPCANSLVATLAETDADIQTCAEWSLTTGIIKEVTNAFGSGQKALVVAGTNAADTRSLAARVMQGTLSFKA